MLDKSKCIDGSMARTSQPLYSAVYLCNGHLPVVAQGNYLGITEEMGEQLCLGSVAPSSQWRPAALGPVCFPYLKSGPMIPFYIYIHNFSERVGAKISGHSIIPDTPFQRRPKSSVIYPSTRGRHLGSSLRRSDEYTTTGPMDGFEHRL